MSSQGFLISPASMLDCKSNCTHQNSFLFPSLMIKKKEQPLVSQAYSCFNISKIVCTSSFLHLSMNVDKEEQITAALNSLTCHEVHMFKRIGSQSLITVSSNVHRSTANSGYSFPLLESRCNTIATYFLEYSMMSTFYSHHIMAGLAYTSACKYDKSSCSANTKILFWDVIPRDQYCTYEKFGETIAEIKGNKVVLEEYKVALSFNNHIVNDIPCIRIKKVHWLNNGTAISFPHWN
uniref:WD_REPEATS_REGION domain-containing protein n=1 Tax=Heterorhabditis bacteriophora TaxID=37862 RepID=A0A1I7W7Y0_HETBA